MEITGKYEANQLTEANTGDSASGAFYSYLGGWKGTSRSDGQSRAIGFAASRSWTGATSTEGGAECRPANYTCRIWKRVA